MESYGYRFDTADRSIVITGDTAPTQATIDACNGCDVLVHEVNTLSALAARPAMFQAFAGMYHPRRPARRTRRSGQPKLLVLYHASISLRPRVNPNFQADAANSSPKSCSLKCSRATMARSSSRATSMFIEIALLKPYRPAQVFDGTLCEPTPAPGQTRKYRRNEALPSSLQPADIVRLGPAGPKSADFVAKVG